jgi:hypothetical protein
MSVLGTWLQILELPFCNYITAITVGIFVPGGTGAGMSGSGCVFDKSNSLLNIVGCIIHHRHEIKDVFHWKKKNSLSVDKP